MRSQAGGRFPEGEVYVTVARPGKAKGNHFHLRMGEWFAVIEGEGKIEVCDPETGQRGEVRLGATLPPGVRVKELVLMTYGALSMQSVMIDATDPAGVLNPEAAEWWQEIRNRLPLTSVPFLGLDTREGA